MKSEESSGTIGGRCTIIARAGRPVLVVGFRNGRALLMPLGSLDGVGLGCKAEVSDGQPEVFPIAGGRVVNALGEPIDGKGPLLNGKVGIPIRNNRHPPIRAAASAARSIWVCGDEHLPVLLLHCGDFRRFRRWSRC